MLGIAGTARLTRIMRANLLDELNKPYVVTARAKGLREWRLVLRYPVRLALNPLISTIGWYLPQLFSGSLIVATVMNLPNIGPLLLRALINQDMYLAGGDPADLLVPDHRRHAAVRHRAGDDGSAHPDGDVGVDQAKDPPRPLAGGGRGNGRPGHRRLPPGANPLPQGDGGAVS